MDRNKPFDKCLTMLNTEQFVEFNKDPTTTTERKVQRVLRRIIKKPTK